MKITNSVFVDNKNKSVVVLDTEGVKHFFGFEIFDMVLDNEVVE